MVRVFVLDDHEMIRAGIRRFLASHGDIELAGEAGTAAEAIEMIPALHPDVAILDVRLPDGDGIQVCREVRSLAPEVRCIFLTSYPDDQAMMDAIAAGAAGYLHKQVKADELVGAIRAVASGASLLDPAVAERVLARLRTGRGSARGQRLSPREQSILDLIADGLTNREIAEQLYLAESTVKSHVSSLLGKLGIRSRTEAAIRAMKGSANGNRPDAGA